MNNTPTCPIRILLVDDEAAILRSLSRVLAEYGFAVETACCAAEADAVLNRYDFDVVVCDHNMPGRTGLELLAGLQTRKPDLITMVLSGQISGVAVAENWASEIGVTAVFPKPFDANQIAERIQSAVQSRKMAIDQQTPIANLEVTQAVSFAL